MINLQNNYYAADEGNMIIRKSDNYTEGYLICLSRLDSISNYGERAATEQEIDQIYIDFYNSLREEHIID